MRHVPSSDIQRRSESFEVLYTAEQSQIASMILQPGEDSGEYGNEHPTCDQVMIVLEGEAEATVNGEDVAVSAGGTLHIKAAEDHQIRNRGSQVLRTINVYAPIAYDEEGEPL